jgi:hypothetical protein
MRYSVLVFCLTLCLGLACDNVGGLQAPSAPTFTKQPSNQIVNAGSNAPFTVTANGNPTPTSIWERSEDFGKTWHIISAANSQTLSIKAELNDNAEFRVKASNSHGNITSKAGSLTVMPTVDAAANTPGSYGAQLVINKRIQRITCLKGISQIPVIYYTDNIFSKLNLQTIIEKEYNRNNIQFIYKKNDDGNPYLELCIYSKQNPNNRLIDYHVVLSFYQNVQLSRDPGLGISAPTWQDSYTNTISRSELMYADMLVADIWSLLGSFFHDYKMANNIE